MRSVALGLLGLAVVMAASLLSLAVGPLDVGPVDLAGALVGEGSPDAELALALRGARVLTALLTGAGLAGAGAALQIIFRNPLVAPDLLGVSSGAGLGAAASILAGAAPVLVQFGAFGGGLAAAACALGCAAMAKGRDPRLTLVLCGVVTGALASAGLALVLVAADPYAQLPAITFWLLGSFGRADLPEAGLALGGVGVGLAGLMLVGFRLDALALGEDQARSLGLPARRLGLAAVAAATLATSSAVAVSGVIGWIGLLAPHAARRIVGPAAQALMPMSVVIGALFALGIDALSTAFGPVEIPVGLLAAGLGAPAFLILFVVTSRRAP